MFPGKKDPQKMLTEKTIREHIKKICGMCRGIDLDKAHPHAFRHMFAIQWINENGNSSLSELAKIMGIVMSRQQLSIQILLKKRRKEK